MSQGNDMVAHSINFLQEIELVLNRRLTKYFFGLVPPAPAGQELQLVGPFRTYRSKVISFDMPSLNVIRIRYELIKPIMDIVSVSI